MTDTIRIGLDIAKTVFQVHGVNAHEGVSVRRSLRRAQLLEWFSKQPPCLVGMEACAGAHYWARELSALGHTVKLMPPGYVKPYVRRNKNDAADAAAICEAVSRPSMRFVQAKTQDQQAAASLHQARQLLIKHQTATSNAIRGLIAEFGLVTPKGENGLTQLLAIIADPADSRIPDLMRAALRPLAAILESLEVQIKAIEKEITAWGRKNAVVCRLMPVPGIGIITATAVAARVTSPEAFDSSRHFAASLGLVPRQDGTGGKVKLGPISKRGDGYLRRLLVNGAMSVLNSKQAQEDPWLSTLLASKERKLVAVALANKMARVIWALMVRGQAYRPRAAKVAA